MHRFIVLVGAILALALSKSTIDDTKLLFKNTIKKWGVQIRNKRDHRLENQFTVQFLLVSFAPDLRVYLFMNTFHIKGVL